MFTALMQRAQEQFSNELPFVIYRKPMQNEVRGIFQHTNDLHLLDDLNKTGFVFAPFDNSKQSILIAKDEVLFATDEMPSKLSSLQNAHPDLSKKEAFKKLVEKAISAIKKGTIQKVVLSRKITVDCDADALVLFNRLAATYQTAFCYLWYHPKVGLWLGATPEILLRTANKQLTTMSLAGTQPFIENKKPLWGEKEFQEQGLVTNYITAALKDKVLGLATSKLETVKAGSLLHLRTKITGRVTSEFGEILDALHPTPAVCGLPKNTSKKFILTNENYDREYYTGFLGELNFKEEQQRTSNRKNQENRAYKAITVKSTLFVNLRCMKLENKTATIYVGGGITGASDPEKEWQETVNKSRTILAILP